MKIKKGDKVIVITGKDKGKSGSVVKAYPQTDQVLLDGINMHKKHQRPKKQGEKGRLIEVAFPMHVSNVRKL